MTDATQKQTYLETGAHRPAPSGAIRTAVLLCTMMTTFLVVPTQVPGLAAFLVDLALSAEPVNAVYALWIMNALLVLKIGLRQSPNLPIWVGLLLCTVGGAMIVGPVTALATAAIVSGLAFGYRAFQAQAAKRHIAARLAPVEVFND